MKSFLNIIIIGEEFEVISKTLKSIKDILDLEEIKIIIVTPKKSNLEKNIFANKRNIYLFNDKGDGVYQAMNIGLSFTDFNFSYIWFLNSGDFGKKYGLKARIYSLLKSNKFKPDIIFYINKDKLTVVNIIHGIFKKIRLKDHTQIKIFMNLLIFPASHQNIFIKKNIHKKFDITYKYSSDFNLIAEIIFLKNKAIKIEESSIAKNSKGGITDINRYQTILERFFILRKIFKYKKYKFLSFLLGISFVFRIFILFFVSSIKFLKNNSFKIIKNKL